jgi:hypothetical protein
VRSAGRSARLEQIALLVAVVVVASWQVTARSEDPNRVALAGTISVVGGSGGDLSQYRILSAYIAVGLQHVFNLLTPPFEAMRFAQCLLIFGLSYAYYGGLGLNARTRLLGIGLVAGLASLSLGRIGPSTFSLDRFTDTIFYLVAALLVIGGREIWTVPLMAFAVANRETSVFMPTLILAWHGPLKRVFTDPGKRAPLLTALAAWAVGALVYFAIHSYFGPRPRTEESYFGPDMFLHSLSMPDQATFFFAAINLLPLLALLLLRAADPFLQRLFWLVVPLWFAIHIWAARLGEGIMYLAPMTVIVIPVVLQGLERRLRQSPTWTLVEPEAPAPDPPASLARTATPAE